MCVLALREMRAKMNHSERENDEARRPREEGKQRTKRRTKQSWVRGTKHRGRKTQIQVFRPKVLLIVCYRKEAERYEIVYKKRRKERSTGPILS